uniref:Ankyrin repeat domain-containing protein n=1 Tax=Acrobeloides nanus TaxID=290746 RepID=A0A914CP74_9BILA
MDYTIKNNPRMVEIDSQQCSPHFLTQDSFYAALNSAPNLFFIDVDIGEIEISADLEATIKDQLKEFKNSIIIQCKSLSNTMVYVKEPNKEPIILDLNNLDLLDEDEFTEKISNKDNFSLDLVITALKSKIVGEFKDGLPRSLNRDGVTFNKPLKDWKLIDYAAWHDNFLLVRFLSLYDWDLDKANDDEEGLRTLEIAAEYASVNTLAALLDLQFPISNEKITLTKDKAALLERKGNIS